MATADTRERYSMREKISIRATKLWAAATRSLERKDAARCSYNAAAVRARVIYRPDEESKQCTPRTTTRESSRESERTYERAIASNLLVEAIDKRDKGAKGGQRLLRFSTPKLTLRIVGELMPLSSWWCFLWQISRLLEKPKAVKTTKFALIIS